MIDEKVLIERLEEESYWTPSTFDEDGYSNDDSEKVIDLYRTIEIVNQLAEEHNNGWIPCSERLPEENDWYYTTLNYRNAVDSGICKFVDGKWSCSEDFEVIAWQHRPAPYQKKE